jgi:hypothetical protein
MQGYNEQTYRQLLSLIRRHGWCCCRFTQEMPSVEKRLFLRHDVDYSLALAQRLAEINAELGVTATFFLQLRSPLYNLLAPVNLARARAIEGMGQRLALHCTVPEPFPETASELRTWVQQEFHRFRDLLPQAEPAFAWHNPTTVLLERFRDLEVPGLVNVYHRRFTREMTYCSDSNFRTPPATFHDQLCNPRGSALHLLLHPVNWTVGGEDMLAVLAGTWEVLLRDWEQEMLTNAVYRQALPQGMPGDLLRDFRCSWEAIARRSAVNSGVYHAA